MKVELFEILARRCVSYSSNPNGKPRIITLRYHLAAALLELITSGMKHPSLGIYEQNKIEILKNELHRLLL